MRGREEREGRVMKEEKDVFRKGKQGKQRKSKHVQQINEKDGKFYVLARVHILIIIFFVFFY